MTKLQRYLRKQKGENANGARPNEAELATAEAMLAVGYLPEWRVEYQAKDAENRRS